MFGPCEGVGNNYFYRSRSFFTDSSVENTYVSNGVMILLIRIIYFSIDGSAGQIFDSNSGADCCIQYAELC